MVKRVRFQKYRWTIRIGSWSLTQWLNFIVLVALVGAAANYITRAPHSAAPSAFVPEPAFSSGESGAQFIGEVSRVVDGDTLDVLRSNVPLRIRLYGIDCPELYQPFGQTAKLLTVEMALHKHVTVRIRGLDKYGRSLGDVAFPDGRVLNQELVKAGLAWWYRKYTNDSQLMALEDEARSKQLGLWSDISPIAPWEFRASR